MLTELVNYSYYKETYGGISIPELSFKKMVIEASSRVNYYTLNRINEKILNDNIRNTACEIAELLYSQELLKTNVLDNTKEKVSETVGKHSVTYANNKSLQEKYILSKSELNNEIYQICLKNLAYTGLMYRGGI